MKIEFIVSKWANFLWFIDSISGHDECWHIYHTFWLKKIKKLTTQEQRAVRDYRKITGQLKNAKLMRNFMAIFCECDNWSDISQKLKSFLNDSQIRLLKGIFDIFKERFEKIWLKYQIKLKSNWVILVKSLNKIQPKLKKYFNHLGKFYGVTYSNELEIPYIKTPLKVFLMMSPLENYSSGRSIGRNIIWLILSDIRKEPKSEMDGNWWLFLHESIHSLFETTKYKNEIKKYVNKQKKLSHLLSHKLSISELIKECIITCLLMVLNNQFGLIHKHNKLQDINMKYLKKCIKRDRKVLFNLNFIKRYTALKLQDLTKNYIKFSQTINKKFIDSIWNVLQNYPKNLLEDIKAD